MNQPAAVPQKNNIFAIASGKGGVGKTFLSVTMSHLFARSGRRVLLFDGDIGLANVDVQLGLTPDRDISTAVSGKAALRECVIGYPGGFDILAGRSGSTSLASVSPTRLSALRDDLLDLSRHYDAVFIDLGAGIEQYVQFMTSVASRVIVIITDEPTSLTDAYAFIKLCVTKLHHPQIYVIVNQAATQKEGEKTYASLEKACQNFLNVSPPLLGIVRKDNKVKEAIRGQVSIIDKASFTLAATDAAAISIKLMQML